MPPQHNPYAQTSTGSPYGPQQPPAYYGMPQPPGTPAPAGGSRGGAGRAVLWAVVGAAVASALWGGGVVLLGKDSGKADLRGYTVKKDLCETADLSAFMTEYPKPDDDPASYTSERDSLVQMYCSKSLEKDSTSYSYAYVSIDANLHRKADPGPEFADNLKSFGDRKDKDDRYNVTAIDGFGDEAYLVTRDTVTTDSDGKESGNRDVLLGVRDGWMTFQLSWTAYASSLEDSDKAPTLSQATEWVKAATKATMAKLK